MLKYQVHGERKRNQHEEPCNHSSPYGRGVLCHRRHYEPNIDHHGRIALLRTRMLSKPISIIQHHLPWTSRHLTAMRPNNTDRKLAFNSNQREQTSRDPHVESGICNEVKSATSWTCDFFPTEWSFIHWALKKIKHKRSIESNRIHIFFLQTRSATLRPPIRPNPTRRGCNRQKLNTKSHQIAQSPPPRRGEARPLGARS